MRFQCQLRESVAYRRDAFISGMQTLGYRHERHIERPGPDDVLIIWNRYGQNALEAERFERFRARVLVTENGHLGKGWRSGVWYALAHNHHAGGGHWPDGGASRWDGWNVALSEWRNEGREYLVLGQRGIGEPGLRSPTHWADLVMERLRKRHPSMLVRIRPHPGTEVANIPLDKDLSHAIAAVTWHSAAASSALVMGVPVFYDCPSWIGASAGRPLADLLAGEPPLRDDGKRLEMFRRLAWAMWELEEIGNGDAFRHMLQPQEVAA